jgi:hypothetical protein
LPIYLQPESFDFSLIQLESLFIEEFVPHAPLLPLKVYLLGLQLLQKGQNPDLSILATRLGVKSEDILEAYKYWRDLGLVRLSASKTSSEEDIHYLSVRDLYLSSNYQLKKSLSSLDRGELYNELFRYVNEVLVSPATEIERSSVIDYLRDKDVAKELVREAFRDHAMQYARGQKVVNTLRYWHDNGIESLEDLEAFKERFNLRQLNYKQVLSALGYPYTAPTQADKDCIDTWLDEYQFDMEKILEKIKEITMNKRNPSMNYLHAAFRNEYEGTPRKQETKEDMSQLSNEELWARYGIKR